MANDYFDSSTLTVVDGELAEAADINSIVAATETAFDLISIDFSGAIEFSSIYYLGPKATAPTVDNDGNALIEGALYFDTALDALRVWDGSSWGDLGKSFYTRYTYTASGGQVTFAAVYTIDKILVYRNGFLLEDTTYTATNGTTVTLDSAATAGDTIEIISFRSFEVANTYSQDELASLIEQGNPYYINTGDLTSLITTIGSTEARVIVTGPVSISDSTIVPSTIDLEIKRPGEISGAFTLTINGGLSAEPGHKWIGVNLTVALSGAKIDAVWPDWWTENVTPGTTNMASAINSAIVAHNTVNFIPDKIYRHDSKIDLKSNLTLNIGSAMLKFYGVSGWAMENPNKETAALSYITINANWDGYLQCAASGADGYLDWRGIQKSSDHNVRVVGYTQTKGSREGIGIRYNRGPSAAIPGWWNTSYRPYVIGFAKGIEISNYANRTTIHDPHIEACDDYGIYNPTNGGDNLYIGGGEVSINGDNASGANIYSDEVSLVVIGTTIEDNSGSGKGVQLGANADGFYVIAKVAAAADAFDIDSGAVGTWQNLARQGELNIARPRFTPQASDFASPVEGLLLMADGTARSWGPWIFDLDNNRYCRLVNREQVVTYSATIEIDCSLGNIAKITLTDGNAYSINAVNIHDGLVLYVQILNSSGGASGTITWNAQFKTSTTAGPANGKYRTFEFVRRGNVFVQSNTPVDVQ